MMMPRGQELLQPVNPAFIVVSLVVALAINLLPLGRVVWLPDMVLLLLAFWGVHQPLRVGMGIAFVLGLCMDVHQSALLGQHALAYATLMLGAQYTHRRLLWFGPLLQALSRPLSKIITTSLPITPPLIFLIMGHFQRRVEAAQSPCVTACRGGDRGRRSALCQVVPRLPEATDGSGRPACPARRRAAADHDWHRSAGAQCRRSPW